MAVDHLVDVARDPSELARTHLEITDRIMYTSSNFSVLMAYIIIIGNRARSQIGPVSTDSEAGPLDGYGVI